MDCYYHLSRTDQVILLRLKEGPVEWPPLQKNENWSNRDVSL